MYPFVACLNHHLTIDHASLSRRSAVPTPYIIQELALDSTGCLVVLVARCTTRRNWARPVVEVCGGGYVAAII